MSNIQHVKLFLTAVDGLAIYLLLAVFCRHFIFQSTKILWKVFDENNQNKFLSLVPLAREFVFFRLFFSIPIALILVLYPFLMSLVIYLIPEVGFKWVLVLFLMFMVLFKESIYSTLFSEGHGTGNLGAVFLHLGVMYNFICKYDLSFECKQPEFGIQKYLKNAVLILIFLLLMGVFVRAFGYLNFTGILVWWNLTYLFSYIYLKRKKIIQKVVTPK